MGVSTKIVQETLNHSSIKLTLDTYSHIMSELKRDAADKPNSLFESKPTEIQQKEVSAI